MTYAVCVLLSGILVCFLEPLPALLTCVCVCDCVCVCLCVCVVTMSFRVPTISLEETSQKRHRLTEARHRLQTPSAKSQTSQKWPLANAAAISIKSILGSLKSSRHNAPIWLLPLNQFGQGGLAVAGETTGHW